MPEPFVTLGGFAGIDNVNDPLEIVANNKLTYLKSGINVDIDDKRWLHRRPGRSRVYTGTPRCFWPQTDVGIDFSLFLESGTLKQLNPDYTTVTLLTGLDTVSDMDFVYVNGRVYYTNSTVIGYIKNEVVTAFPSPASDKQFKRILRAGRYIEYYRSRLYTAKDNVLSFSDAVRFYRMDKRYNYKQFDGIITMVRAVNDGLYVSAGENTYFIAGASPEKMIPNKVTDSPAFPGSGVRVGTQELASGGRGYVVYWESDEGIFVGGAGGEVKNVTWDVFQPTISPNKACAIYRNGRGLSQYICVYELPERLHFDISGRIPLWNSSILIS